MRARHTISTVLFTLLPFIALTIFSAAPIAAADDDAKMLQGTWVPAKAELAGTPLPDSVLKTITLKLDNGKYEALAGDAPDRGTYTLDLAANPRGMTITSTEGANNGKTFPAIYELAKDDKNGPDQHGDAKADTLRICYDLSGAKRPADFKTAPGTRLYLVTYTRKQR